MIVIVIFLINSDICVNQWKTLGTELIEFSDASSSRKACVTLTKCKVVKSEKYKVEAGEWLSTTHEREERQSNKQLTVR